MFKYIYNVKKKTCLGVFRIEKERDDDNEIGLKERKIIEIEIAVLSIAQCTASPFGF